MIMIHNYAIKVASLTSIEVPQGARFLSVQPQAGELSAWYLVDTEKPLESRSLLVAVTGQDLSMLRGLLVANNSVLSFLGTVQLAGGGFVVHVFDLT